MILIVDCGSTKADWALLDGGKIVKRFTTDGFNPNFCDLDIISRMTLDNIGQIVDIKQVTNVYYYGTGCGNEANVMKIKNVFSDVFKGAEIKVYSDILGSCHALFGKKSGVACILGTGSNACFYDGEKITRNAVSLGYVLGDEGSGCHIGRKIIRDYFYGIMPMELREKFDNEFHLDRDTLIQKVYKEPYPSKYLATFSKFAYQHIENQYVVGVVESCFDDFVKYYIKPLLDEDNIQADVSFVGSVAFYFQETLKKCLEKQGIKCVEILRSPMDGLISYHQ